MSSVLTNNSEFKGGLGPHRQITVASGGTAAIYQQQVAANGTVTWVEIPDGFLSGPTSITLLTTPNAVYRVENVSGLVTLD